MLFGHCTEGLAVPYQPWIEALSHLIEHAPDEMLTAHVDAYGPILARIVPALCRRVEGADPGDGSSMADGERYALLEAIRGLLTAAAADGLVVILDDLQWADTASMQVLRHLLVGGAPSPMLVIVTYRDTDLTRDHPLTGFLADLHREPWVHRTALRGLSDKDLLELMEGAAGYEMDADGLALAQALHRETDGNPFFTGEMLRHLFETGAIAFDDTGRYILTIDLAQADLPGSVRDVVLRRVDRLGDYVNSVLTLASVIGREFDLTVLADITDDHDEDTVLDLLEAASDAALITEVGELPGRFRFEHALIQHSLYQDLGATRRQRLHQRIAEALEARVGASTTGHAELAHHWLAATRPSDAAKAIEYARLAGEEAVQALAPDDAIQWFTQALELHERVYPDDLAVRCDLLTGLGTAQHLGARPEFCDTLLGAARLAEDLDDSDRLTRVALAIASDGINYTPDPRVAPVVEAAIARGASEGPRAAQLYAALVYETDPTRSVLIRERARTAVEIARRSDDEATLLHALITLGAVAGGTAPEALPTNEMEQALEMALQLGDRRAEFYVRYHMSALRMQQGDITGSDDAADRAEEIARGLRLPYFDWLVLVDRAARTFRAGDFTGAERLADDALALASRAGIGAGIGVYGAQLTELRKIQGRSGEIAEFLSKQRKSCPTSTASASA